jgi:hypothetical protein
MLIAYYFASWLLLHLMRGTMFLLAHIYAYMLDHTEAELEESMEHTQVEDLTNLTLDQDKPWCI